ncbi:Integral membrane protein, related [Neospora caninum Liverpool]|uniref:Hexose transporter 1 n=1 Tax=Neospora caninum (strain Liverpool) TaxID=572307 RepID=F0VHK1_NEOCL|nr:Integral membrane protein, related [Neospora caninum Liverpool]CBZ53195.1 Integral membrane protein, related [Neospora caninum Liverpool]CEL67185.1 TPA: Integral membrane protein, related [Neospora caninum Liverpool]|eukprot:XP_003883227.1 Integral membrane protein, related [Neospora caninum Liverpool]
MAVLPAMGGEADLPPSAPSTFPGSSGVSAVEVTQPTAASVGTAGKAGQTQTTQPPAQAPVSSESMVSTHIELEETKNQEGGPFPHSPTKPQQLGSPVVPVRAGGGEQGKRQKRPGVRQPLGLRFFLAVFTACLTGLIAGYDLCCVSVVLNPVQHAFGLCGSSFTCADKSMFIALFAPGAAIGGLCGGLLADAVGRRTALFLSDVLVVMGGLFISVGVRFAHLLLGRFLLGLATGVGFVVIATYISEIAPQSLRGALVSSQEMLQVCGCLSAYGAAWAFGAWTWRPLLEVIPALGVLQALCLVFFLPESPRWLIQRGLLSQAERALVRLGMSRESAAVSVVHLRRQANHQSQPGIGEYFQNVRRGVSAHKRALGIAVACAVAHLATGGSTLQYFVVDIFQFAGICDTRAAGFLVGIAKMAGVVTCVGLVDVWGRRKLLFLGVGGSCLCHILLTVAFGMLQVTRGHLSGRCAPDALTAGWGHLEPASYLALSAVLSYIFFWSAGWASLMLVIASEVAPTCVRGVGVGLTTMTSHVGAFALQIGFEPLFESVTQAGTFSIFVVTSLLSLIFTLLAVPEAKGCSLETLHAEDPESGHKTDGSKKNVQVSCGGNKNAAVVQ